MARAFVGLDYGAARIGIAVGDDDTKIATALRTVAPAELPGVLASLEPLAAIIVGLPRSLDGTETAQTLAVRRFSADHLDDIGLEIIFQDEFATSSVAEERLKERGKPYARPDIDAEAATIILQDYLDGL